MFESEEKWFFCLFVIKTYSRKKNGLQRFNFYLQLCFRRLESQFYCRLRAAGGRLAEFERPTDGRDSDKEFEAYADELLADDKWLAIYVEERKTDEELEKQLQY